MIHEITDIMNITIVSMTLQTMLTIPNKSTSNILDAGIILSLTCRYGAGTVYKTVV